MVFEHADFPQSSELAMEAAYAAIEKNLLRGFNFYFMNQDLSIFQIPLLTQSSVERQQCAVL